MWLIIVVILTAVLPGCAEASAHYMYDGEYDVLRVGEVRFNDTMAFPASMATEVRRRYVLTGVELGTRYLVHLSHLGSPSIEYRIHVGRVHRSAIKGKIWPAKELAPGRRKLADVIMLHFKTHVDELLFDYIDGDGDVDNGDTEYGVKNDDLVVLEIRGTRNAFPVQPDKWRKFSYNLRVEAIGSGSGINRLIMWHAMLVIAAVAVVVVLVPRLIGNTIACDAPMPTRPRYDFLIFLVNKRTKTKA
ncbi:hypothetical protein TcG_06698 [Trypanosoma cruzi]|uniref:Uncharacterized protein n=2 Tax=Trypanosoma cruzi TaxID=5693 RepID=V5B7Z9_TRYCR|nr:hypothetical protein TCDM_08349 [Trypanosoma cruzi Dm28c]PBJ76757.1 hypothetical protein BCY84_07914 [Trypanosoma cruzi cruzi]PWU97212.1 hypothetical protein C4B63_16g16 [Trypanosoma cruzi]RNF16118.1 hypothetical protein TcG_06698 [Trypanosoma cruzi]